MFEEINRRQPVGQDAVKVKEYHRGEGFGEIALLNNVRRKASVVCQERTEFVILDKKIYQAILYIYIYIYIYILIYKYININNI